MTDASAWPTGYHPLGGITPDAIGVAEVVQVDDATLVGDRYDDPPEVDQLPPDLPGASIAPTPFEPATGPFTPRPVAEIAADDWTASDVVVPAAKAVRLTSRMDTRRRLLVMVTGAGGVAAIGRDENSAPTGWLMADTDPALELRHREEVWVYSTAGTTVSFLAEFDHDA